MITKKVFLTFFMLNILSLHSFASGECQSGDLVRTQSCGDWLVDSKNKMVCFKNSGEANFKKSMRIFAHHNDNPTGMQVVELVSLDPSKSTNIMGSIFYHPTVFESRWLVNTPQCQSSVIAIKKIDGSLNGL